MSRNTILRRLREGVHASYPRFDIFAARNTTVPPTDTPQLFRAGVDVLGDGVTVLDTREVFFLVPPDSDSVVIF